MRIIHIYSGKLFHFISKSVLSYKISKSNLELDSKLGKVLQTYIPSSNSISINSKQNVLFPSSQKVQPNPSSIST